MSRFDDRKTGALDKRELEQIERNWSDEQISPFFIAVPVVTLLAICYVFTNFFTIRIIDGNFGNGIGGVSYTDDGNERVGHFISAETGQDENMARQSDMENPGIDEEVIELEKYLEGYGSPLSPYADEIIDTANEKRIHNLYKLVVAIAAAESTFGKVCPLHNAWGIKCGRTTYCTYDNWSEGISAIIDLLASDIYSLGEAVTKEDIWRIASTYAESPRWADSVMYFWNELN